LRNKRTIAVLLTAILVTGLLLGSTADARKRRRKPPVCKKYNGGVDGKGQKVTLVTDKAKQAKPVTVPIEVAAGVGGTGPDDNEGSLAPSHQVMNIQVDSKAKMTGLYAVLEGPPLRDLDLYISGPDGVAVAYSAGFQAAPVIPGVTDGTGHGGKTTTSTEQVDGLATKDCTGYTVEVWGAGNEPLTATLKFYLGKVLYVPGQE